MSADHFIACHECDLIHKLPDLPVGGAARCLRCDATLYRPRKDSLNRTLALAIAGIILFAVANTFPFIGFEIQAQIRETTLATGVYELYRQDMGIIATLVLATVVVIPLTNLLCLLYILIPLQLKRIPKFLAPTFRLYLFLKPWGMMEIFMLGILVSGFKLIKMASIIPGLSLFAFSTLIFVLSTIVATLDEQPHLGENRLPMSYQFTTARQSGLVSCRCCHLLCKRVPAPSSCPRCGTRLHSRKPKSIARTWALVVAAIIFYIPANIFPITQHLVTRPAISRIPSSAE